MTDNNAASDKEKVVTKYDRKMQKRKEEARKEAKRRFITKWVYEFMRCVLLIWYRRLLPGIILPIWLVPLWAGR